MRKLATIRRVDDIRPIEGADAIELALLGGWQVVVRKSQGISPGMLVVYCEIDSVFPEDPRFEFLRRDKFRLRTKKFRGALSQGIVFGIEEVLPPGAYAKGADVTGLLDITLYEPPIPPSISGEALGPYPSSVPRTDEERVQNIDLGPLLGMEFLVTEKLDGTSCSFILDERGFHVCGRKWELRDAPGQTFWELARRYDIEAGLREQHRRTGTYLALQGEVIGHGIQTNVYGLKGQDCFVFNIFDAARQRFLDAAGYRATAEALGVRTVPVIEERFRLEAQDHAALLAMAEGGSALNPAAGREGLVFRTLEETPGNQGKISFKVISNRYLLKHG